MFLTIRFESNSDIHQNLFEALMTVQMLIFENSMIFWCVDVVMDFESMCTCLRWWHYVRFIRNPKILMLSKRFPRYYNKMSLALHTYILVHFCLDTGRVSFQYSDSPLFRASVKRTTPDFSRCSLYSLPVSLLTYSLRAPFTFFFCASRSRLTNSLTSSWHSFRLESSLWHSPSRLSLVLLLLDISRFVSGHSGTVSSRSPAPFPWRWCSSNSMNCETFLVYHSDPRYESSVEILDVVVYCTESDALSSFLLGRIHLSQCFPSTLSLRILPIQT